MKKKKISTTRLRVKSFVTTRDLLKGGATTVIGPDITPICDYTDSCNDCEGQAQYCTDTNDGSGCQNN